MQDVFEEINKLSESEIAANLRPARVSGYICPKCKNGGKNKGTGIKARNLDGKLRWKCFSCGTDFSNVDLLLAERGSSLVELSAWYKGEPFFSSKGTSTRAKTKIESGTNAGSIQNADSKEVMKRDNQQEPKRDYSKFYVAAQEKLKTSDISEIRGIPIEILQQAKAGLANAKMLKAVGENIPYSAEVLVLPYNKHHFFMRSFSGKFEVKRGNTGGVASEIYNPFDVFAEYDGKLPVLVVEGQIDTLSIRYALEVPVIATNGTANLPNLPARIAELNLPIKPRFVIIADNDKEGKVAAEKAVENLKLAGYAAQTFTLSTGEEKTDANKILQEVDGLNNLQTALVNIVETAEKNFAVAENQEVQSEIQNGEIEMKKTDDLSSVATRRNNFFTGMFENEVKQVQKFFGRKTGFENVDSQQLLYPALYIVGGVPSIGKTSFMWQLLEQMAEQGEHCIYCSYEMSKLELFSKSVSRKIYLRDRNFALSAAEIRRGSYNEVSRAVIEELQKDDSDISVLELTDETIDELLKTLQPICAKLDKPPVICIDYLQLVGSENSKDAKSKVDDVARKLKQFQRDTGTTFFVISSFNRTNYNQSVSFESFKESGGIEFSADVVWGLQLYVTKELNNLDTKGNREKIDAAKKEKPRKVQLKCLKNRNGSLYDAFFKYYPANDYFRAVEESALKYSNNKSETDIDEWDED